MEQCRAIVARPSSAGGVDQPADCRGRAAASKTSGVPAARARSRYRGDRRRVPASSPMPPDIVGDRSSSRAVATGSGTSHVPRAPESDQRSAQVETRFDLGGRARAPATTRHAASIARDRPVLLLVDCRSLEGRTVGAPRARFCVRAARIAPLRRRASPPPDGWRRRRRPRAFRLGSARSS